MAIPSPGGFLRLSIVGTVPQDTWSVNFWLYESNTAVSPTTTQLNSELTALANLFNTTCWSAASNPMKGNNWPAISLTGAKGTYYLGGTPAIGSKISITAVPGTAASNVDPAWMSTVVTLQSALAGRRHRGRVYCPATSPGMVSSDLQASQAHIDAYKTNLVAFLQGVNARSPVWTATAWQAVIVSQVAGGDWKPIVSVAVDSLLDTQRGRQNKAVATRVSTGSV